LQKERSNKVGVEGSTKESHRWRQQILPEQQSTEHDQQSLTLIPKKLIAKQ